MSHGLLKTLKGTPLRFAENIGNTMSGIGFMEANARDNVRSNDLIIGGFTESD